MTMTNADLISEVLRLDEEATKGPWRYVPWHIEEGPSAVRAPDGHLICDTAGDGTAAAIAHYRTSAPELARRLRETEEKLARANEAAHAAGFAEGVEAAAKVAENPGFIQARDTEWDSGVNYAKRFIAAALRRLTPASKPAGSEQP